MLPYDSGKMVKSLNASTIDASNLYEMPSFKTAAETYVLTEDNKVYQITLNAKAQAAIMSGDPTSSAA